jgi:hypothetical protein
LVSLVLHVSRIRTLVRRGAPPQYVSPQAIVNQNANVFEALCHAAEQERGATNSKSRTMSHRPRPPVVRASAGKFATPSGIKTGKIFVKKSSSQFQVKYIMNSQHFCKRPLNRFQAGHT